jgi:hypothetical protein
MNIENIQENADGLFAILASFGNFYHFPIGRRDHQIVPLGDLSVRITKEVADKGRQNEKQNSYIWKVQPNERDAQRHSWNQELVGIDHHRPSLHPFVSFSEKIPAFFIGPQNAV